MDILTWADWERAPDKTEAEIALVEASKLGVPCHLSGQRPTSPRPEILIRAELLRYLILGGCDAFQVHTKGVNLSGAWVTGLLDLDFAEAQGGTRLRFTTFDQSLRALQTSFELLDLSGSMTNGLKAGGCDVRGSVHLKSGFVSKDTVDLAGARIGGELHCESGGFEAERGPAIDGTVLQVTGSIYMSAGFTAHGVVTFANSQIGGSVDCEAGRFDGHGEVALNFQRARINGSLLLRAKTEVLGELRLIGTVIGGNLTLIDARLSSDAKHLLNGQRMRIDQVLFMKGLILGEGKISLNEARCAALADDMESWPSAPKHLDIDGMVYDRITDGVTSFRGRRAWLRAAGRGENEFRPQPYVRCAQVLRDMGHEREARSVLIASRREAHAYGDSEMLHRAKGPFALAVALVLWFFRRFWSHTQRLTVGYGFAPWRSITVLLVLVTLATFLAHRTWINGAMAPNSGPILLSDSWQSLSEDPDIRNPALVWSCGHDLAEGETCRPVGRDWETFNRYAYGFDVVVPVLNLGQTDAWAPSTSRGDPWGKILWVARWLLSGLGWLVTALAAAAVTGIIRQD